MRLIPWKITENAYVCPLCRCPWYKTRISPSGKRIFTCGNGHADASHKKVNGVLG